MTLVLIATFLPYIYPNEILSVIIILFISGTFVHIEKRVAQLIRSAKGRINWEESKKKKY
jgi:hypothetical protein